MKRIAVDHAYPSEQWLVRDIAYIYAHHRTPVLLAGEYPTFSELIKLVIVLEKFGFVRFRSKICERRAGLHVRFSQFAERWTGRTRTRSWRPVRVRFAFECWTLKKPHEMNAKILISHIFKNVSPATTHAKSTGSYQSFQYPPIWSSLQVCLASLLALRLPPPLETTVIDSTGWRFDAFNVHIWLTTRKSDLEETRRSSKVRACLK